jgi:predicted DNA-binding transcriptional regulator AlpA
MAARPLASDTSYIALPTLDELAADPTKAAELSPDVAQRMCLRCIAALTALSVTAAAIRPSATAPAEDCLIGPQEVADMIGMSRSWVEKHTDVLPPRRSVEGSPRWLRSDVVRWLRNRPAYGGRGLR